jgi:RNA polymerase sigma-70 factor (ECF subfamily)
MVWMAGDDEAEVLEARRGDRDAFRGLVQRYSPALFRLAYRMTGNEQDAEDVVQETFLKAYRRLGQFESRSLFSTWLHRIAANCAYDLMRRRARQKEDPGDLSTIPQASTAEPSPDRIVLSGEIASRLAAALGRLSPAERSAFVLRHHEGLSIQEIGATLGLETSAVKQCIFRAVRKMRLALSPLAGVPS